MKKLAACRFTGWYSSMQKRLCCYYNSPVALDSQTNMFSMEQTQQTLHDNSPAVLRGAQELHYDGPATRCVDFILLHRRYLTYAVRLRWRTPVSRVLCVVPPHASLRGVDRT